MKDIARVAASTVVITAGLGLAGLGAAAIAQAQPAPFPDYHWCPGDSWDWGWGNNWDWWRCHDDHWYDGESRDQDHWHNGPYDDHWGDLVDLGNHTPDRGDPGDLVDLGNRTPDPGDLVDLGNRTPDRGDLVDLGDLGNRTQGNLAGLGKPRSGFSGNRWKPLWPYGVWQRSPNKIDLHNRTLPTRVRRDAVVWGRTSPAVQIAL